jgi:hypothetical protein
MSRKISALRVAGLLAPFALSTPFSAAAAESETSASFVDIAFVSNGRNESGGSLHASRGLGDRWQVHGHLESFDYKDGNESNVANSASLGVGVRWSLAPTMQLVFAVSGEVISGASDGGYGWDDDGIDVLAAGVGAGLELRSRISRRLQLQGGVKAVAIAGAGDSDLFATSVGARFYFSDHLAAGLDLANDYFGSRIRLALRYDFQGF